MTSLRNRTHGSGEERAAPKAHIFLGPSLPRVEAETILGSDAAIYHLPVRRGDMDSLAQASGIVVGIVDGVFHESPAVSVYEIRHFIERGGTVFGAASMGALRAVDLRPCGMRGVGQIYEDFATGRLEGDDEVALIFDPSSGSALSVTLVHVRSAIDACVRRGRIDAADAARALSAAREIYYADRCHAELLAAWQSAGLATATVAVLAASLDDPGSDPKRDNARLLLMAVRTWIEQKA